METLSSLLQEIQVLQVEFEGSKEERDCARMVRRHFELLERIQKYDPEEAIVSLSEADKMLYERIVNNELLRIEETLAQQFKDKANIEWPEIRDLVKECHLSADAGVGSGGIRSRELIVQTEYEDGSCDYESCGDPADYGLGVSCGHVSLKNYLRGLAEIGRLILTIGPIPDDLKHVVSETRKCFAYRNYLAACCLCRSVMEIALDDLNWKLFGGNNFKLKQKHESMWDLCVLTMTNNYDMVLCP